MIQAIALPLLKKFWQPIAIALLLGGLILAGKSWLHGRDQANYEAGYAARAEIAHQEAAKEVALRVERITQNTAHAARLEAGVVAKLKNENQAFAALAEDLSARLALQEAAYSQEKPDEPKPLLGQSVLDAGTVGLLNAARTGPVRLDANGRATFGAHEEGAAPAYVGRTVTGREFAENDLEVTRLYRALAINHDALVDWVHEQCLRKP